MKSARGFKPRRRGLLHGLVLTLALAFAAPAIAQGPPAREEQSKKVRPDVAVEARQERSRRGGGQAADDEKEADKAQERAQERVPDAPRGPRAGNRPELPPQAVSGEDMRKQVQERKRAGEPGARPGMPHKVDREQMVAMRRAVHQQRTQLQQEREHHIRRMAQIARIRELGEEKEQTPLVEKANLLEAKEKQRHERKMQVLHRQPVPEAKGRVRGKADDNGESNEN